MRNTLLRSLLLEVFLRVILIFNIGYNYTRLLCKHALTPKVKRIQTGVGIYHKEI